MILIVGGPAGSGKSTTGELVSTELGVKFIEGDELHPKANIDKMAQGIPLTDDDRWGWLEAVAATANENDPCVVSCSALKKIYRDLLHNLCPKAVIVLLTPSPEDLMERLAARKNHYMKADMLQSQLDILEYPKNEPRSGFVIPKSLENRQEVANDVLTEARELEKDQS